MQIGELFEKKIDRPIEGVIKADDLSRIKLEIEEYVITNEVGQRLEVLFESYTDYMGANGVWISGFFGSGKSHLLKMLAYLLENNDVDGKSVIDYFLPKCDENAMLKGLISKVGKFPSKSILFNIDQKADTISKTETDALLAVFVKVFDEMQGYYGKQAYIAKFEKVLDRRGLLDDFKKEYEKTAGKSWDQGREEIILEKHNVAKAYAEVSGEPLDVHKNIIDAYRQDYKLSIEDFAKEVSDYINKQGKDFHINFFADEVGQYIANNVKLMTNLQTIAESLATKCNGQAWLFVTAQEDMGKVIGQFNEDSANDFSKIQDRFKTRLKLTSQNVDEVIQRRLLKKSEAGADQVEEIYDHQKNNFGTLFDFTDGATKYQNYRDKKHFTNAYPFIPYQFTLFQSSIENLSLHNAFEGKHSSVGERSMLGVFQEVAVKISDKPLGQLAPFDLMYEGISTALKAQLQRAILNANQHLGNPFAVRLLRALLLVKYVKGFNATPRNLRVLVQDSFEQDIVALQKEVQVALDLLFTQTYVQRNGDTYEYLTDEEKDIEEEIKRENAEPGEIQKELDAILFTEVIREPKIRYGETNVDYRFTRKIDDHIMGQEQELSIHFVTPFSENTGNLTTLQGNSLGKSEMMVVLPPNQRLVQELQLYVKTNTFIRKNRTTAQQDSRQMILAMKANQNIERFSQIKTQLKELISQANFIVSGNLVEISGEDPRTRIIKAFDELIVRTYPNLLMIKDKNYKEEDIHRLLEFNKGAMLDVDLNEAEMEVFSYIQSNKSIGVNTTMKNLVDRFSTKPYGWHLAAVQCIVAILVGRGKIELKSDGNTLENQTLEQGLKNTQSHNNVLVIPQAVFNPQQIQGLKDFFGKFFDQPARCDEPKLLANETKEAFIALEGDLRELRAEHSQYPFLEALQEPIQKIEDLFSKDYSYYLTDLPGRKDEFMQMKKDLIDPIQSFMHSTNRDIYDQARRFIATETPNLEAIGNGRSQKIKDILNHPECYKGNSMKEAKDLITGLQADIKEMLVSVKEEASLRCDRLAKDIQNLPHFEDLEKTQKAEIGEIYDDYKRQIEGQNWISVIRDQVARYEVKQNDVMSKVINWAEKKEGEKVELVSLQHVADTYEKTILENLDDIEQFLTELKDQLLKVIKENKRIRIK